MGLVHRCEIQLHIDSGPNNMTNWVWHDIYYMAIFNNSATHSAASDMYI